MGSGGPARPNAPFPQPTQWPWTVYRPTMAKMESLIGHICRELPAAECNMAKLVKYITRPKLQRAVGVGSAAAIMGDYRGGYEYSIQCCKDDLLAGNKQIGSLHGLAHVIKNRRILWQIEELTERWQELVSEVNTRLAELSRQDPGQDLSQEMKY